MTEEGPPAPDPAGWTSNSRPGRPPRIAVLAAVVVAAVVAGIVVLATRHDGGGGQGASAEAALSTDTAHFVLPRLSGTGTVRLADFRGRPVVVNFFASWCTACRGEAPGFLRIDTELHGAVAFVGVNSLETGDGLAFAKELGYTRWPLARDIDGVQDSGLHDALRGQGMPITAFYSADGKLLFVAPGALADDTLRSRIHDLFGI